MAHNAEKPRWALALKARREAVVGSQEELSARSGISQSLISQLERGIQQPNGLAVERFAKLLDTLNWTVGEFEEATGLRFEGLRTGAGQDDAGLIEFRQIPHLGPLSNLTRVNYNSPMSSQQWPTHPDLSSFDDADLFTVDVMPDALADDEARASIPVGSRALFHRSLTPQPGDLVLATLDGSDGIYEYGAKHAVLRSYNDEQPPVILTQQTRAQVRGVYLMHLSPLRRRKT